LEEGQAAVDTRSKEEFTTEFAEGAERNKREDWIFSVNSANSVVNLV